MIWHRDLSLMNKLIELAEDTHHPTRRKWDFVPHPKDHVGVIAILDAIDAAISVFSPYTRADYDASGRQADTPTRDRAVLEAVIDAAEDTGLRRVNNPQRNQIADLLLPGLVEQSADIYNERYGVFFSLDLTQPIPAEDFYEPVDPATLDTNPRFRAP